MSKPNPTQPITNLGQSLPELEQCCQKEQRWVIADWIPEQSVNIVCGDSGLGKSPLVCQMALAVALGSNFLGQTVQKGAVCFIDLENGQRPFIKLAKRLAGFTGSQELPSNFFYFEQSPNLATVLKSHCPALVVIDSLRSFSPGIEAKNETAARTLAELKRIAKTYKTAFLLVHHVRKPGVNGSPSLEFESAMQWLFEASGARALINQSDVRIAVDRPMNTEGPALVLKGHARLVGEFGPMYLFREYDEEGEALGYRLASGVELLSSECRQAFDKLPVEFTFKQAKQAYGKLDEATKGFLRKCFSAGLIEQPIKRGPYRKLSIQSEQKIKTLVGQ